MLLPQRVNEHVREKISVAIVEGTLPREWISRKLDQDYGIDLHVEIVNGKNVTGKMFLAQVKSNELSPRADGIFVLTGIKKTTIRYWMEIPIPVFLFWVKMDDGKCYVVNIKDYIRRNYLLFHNANDTMSFEFSPIQNEIDLEDPSTIIVDLYNREIVQEDLVRNVKHFILCALEDIEHMKNGMDRDCFMPLEDFEYALVVERYERFEFLVNFFMGGIKIPCLREKLQEDRRTFGRADGYDLHEQTRDFLYKTIFSYYPELAEKCSKYITDHSEYFFIKDRKLFNVASNFEKKDISEWCRIR